MTIYGSNSNTLVLPGQKIEFVESHISHARGMVTYTTGQELSVPCCYTNDFMLYHLFTLWTSVKHFIAKQQNNNIKQFLKAADVSLKKNISTIGYGAKYFLFT